MNSLPSQNQAQGQYQVRFDWGVDGAAAIAADADVILFVDALDASIPDLPASSALVVAADLRNRRAVAEWTLAQQGDKGDRFVVAVVAAGAQREHGTLRFAVEDLFAAGAVIDALADAGIDYCSPEAAAASAAFTGLRTATGHLIRASAGARELTAAGRKAEVDAAIAFDSSTEVPVLREFSRPA